MRQSRSANGLRNMYTLTASPSVVSIGSSAALDPEKYKLRLENCAPCHQMLTSSL